MAWSRFWCWRCSTETARVHSGNPHGTQSVSATRPRRNPGRTLAPQWLPALNMASVLRACPPPLGHGANLSHPPKLGHPRRLGLITRNDTPGTSAAGACPVLALCSSGAVLLLRKPPGRPSRHQNQRQRRKARRRGRSSRPPSLWSPAAPRNINTCDAPGSNHTASTPLAELVTMD